MSLELLGAFVSVILIDLVLSGDNAVVIALAVRNLEGNVRRRAILIGVAGAIGLRLLFVFIISLLLDLPVIHVVGGVLLIYIAWNLAQQSDDEQDVKAGSGLWGAVWTIMVADVVMSFDNVVALVAASGGRVWLVALGIALTIPLIIFGATILSNLMNRFPIIVYVGAGLLVYLGVEMFYEEPLLEAFSRATEGFHQIIAIGTAVVFTAIAYLFSRRSKSAKTSTAE